jgi:NAD(P)-dependent dehydrogenase (short-subunit alcohol dehydrogenase family)
MSRSCVVTGGGGGIGRAIADRLLADRNVVVVLDRDDAALGWTSAHPAGRRVIPLAGDAADEAVTEQAADLAGLTRALAVDYGPRGIRVNAVALGSIATERYQAFLAGQQPAAAARVQDQMRALHPLGRVGTPGEVAAAVGYLLSEDAAFVNGAILPVDGGRSVLGLDPEQA